MIVVQWAMRSAEGSCGALQALQASSRDVARASAPELTVAAAGTAKAKRPMAPPPSTERRKSYHRARMAAPLRSDWPTPAPDWSRPGREELIIDGPAGQAA